ncbi:MAG TPA: hypothetical protein VMI06_08260, partial [Terriglobia bacterium]|nr:hypothetical protein [Terriglobia bacterium]
IIETGLDLLSHPTLIFYESGYSLHTLRQASRRSWRIGQWQPVRVFYLHYKDTVQTACLRLMGKKLLVSLTMEGKFSPGGLQALDDGDDMLTAMARELVTERGIGEPADVVWRQIQAEQNRMVPAAAHGTDPIRNPPSDPPKISMPVAEMQVLRLPSPLIFGSRPSASRLGHLKKRSNPAPGRDQLSLF